MRTLLAAGMLDMLPGFNAGVHTLYALLLAPAAVIIVGGSYFHVGQFYVGRQGAMVPMLLLRIFLTVLTILCFPDWGNLLLQVVNSIPQEMGMNWSGADPGTTYEDYRSAIASEFGTNSVAKGQQQLYQTVRSQGTAQSQGLSAPTNANVHFTRYGYAGDSTPDTNSENGTGNHNNQLVAVQSVAISNALAQQYGLQVGQSVQFTTSSGQTYTGTYDDTVPDGVWKNPTTGQISLTQQPGYTQYVDESNNIDLYDPNGQLTNLDGAAITGINGMGATSAVNAPTSTPTGGTDAPGWIKKIDDALSSWILAPIAYGLSVAAAGVMWFMSGLQEFFFLMEVAVSPVFVATLMVPALVPLASRFITSFASVCLWPLGWVIADLVTKGLIDLAVNPTNNAGLALFDGFGGAYAIWIVIAVWVFFSAFLGPFIAAAAFVTGSSGTGAMIGAAFGASVSALTSKQLLQALMMGAGAVRALGGAGGANGSGANGGSPSPAFPAPRRGTAARRPTRQEEEGA